MGARALVFIAVATSGCLKITPLDGTLQCASSGVECPSGYYCATDRACWHMGKGPTTSTTTIMSQDMSMSTVGADMDGGGTTTMLLSCMLPSDCPTPSKPCLLQACVGGQCALVNAPEGTMLPSAQQKPNDCLKLVCDANGNPMPIADPTDKPIDLTGGCATPSCDGPTPTFAPTPVNTKCNNDGVCNGGGICGVCTPNAITCKGATTSRQQCNAKGEWVDLDTCNNACTNGQCTGACNATSPTQCDAPSGSTHIGTCVNNQWVYTSCDNGSTTVCLTVNGVGTCSGTCHPAPSSCNGAVVTGCSANGQPVNPSNAPCPGWCLNGGCVACQPNATRCMPSMPGYIQTCDATGNWGAATSCNVAMNGGTWSCADSGAAPQLAKCTCTDPNANSVCGSFVCGSVNDACGNPVNCGTCPVGDRCTTSHTCVPKVITNGGGNVTTDATHCVSKVC